jgi:hypothetical protein
MPVVTYEKDGAVGLVTNAKPPIDGMFLDDLLAAYRSAVADGRRAAACTAAAPAPTSAGLGAKGVVAIAAIGLKPPPWALSRQPRS